jgi:hypothetical protein
MDFSLSGTVLTRDLFSADGRLVASRGEIVDLGRLKEVAASAPRNVRERPLFETPCAQAILEAFEAAPLQYVVGTEDVRALAAEYRAVIEKILDIRGARGIAQALRGDGSRLLALSDEYTERDPKGHYGEDMTAYSPIYCLDHAVTAGLEQILAQSRALGATYPPLGDFISTGAVQCEVWPLKAVTPAQRLTAPGAGPILVVGTTDDPATPYEWAKSLASQLSSGRLLTRTGQGHAGYRQGNACIDTAIHRYLVQGILPTAGTVCDD